MTSRSSPTGDNELLFSESLNLSSLGLQFVAFEGGGGGCLNDPDHEDHNDVYDKHQGTTVPSGRRVSNSNVGDDDILEMEEEDDDGNASFTVLKDILGESATFNDSVKMQDCFIGSSGVLTMDNDDSILNFLMMQDSELEAPKSKLNGIKTTKKHESAMFRPGMKWNSSDEPELLSLTAIEEENAQFVPARMVSVKSMKNLPSTSNSVSGRMMGAAKQATMMMPRSVTTSTDLTERGHAIKRGRTDPMGGRNGKFTPYDALKDLISFKKIQSASSTSSFRSQFNTKMQESEGRFMIGTATDSRSQVGPAAMASVFGRPSSFFGTRTAEPDFSKSSTVDMKDVANNVAPVRTTPAVENHAFEEVTAIPSPEATFGSPNTAVDALLFHKACRQACTQSIQNILSIYPGIAGIQGALMTSKKVYDPQSRSVAWKHVKEQYTYPLNLAIQYHAEVKAIEALVTAAPQVLSIKDGPLHETPLHVLLRHYSDRPAVLRPGNNNAVTAKLPGQEPAPASEVALCHLVDMMLLTDPELASQKDRRENTPLHVACMRGAPFDVVRHLLTFYPVALEHHNFDGQTPAQLAQRQFGNTCPRADAIAQFLMRKTGSRSSIRRSMQVK